MPFAPTLLTVIIARQDIIVQEELVYQLALIIVLYILEGLNKQLDVKFVNLDTLYLPVTVTNVLVVYFALCNFCVNQNAMTMQHLLTMPVWSQQDFIKKH